MILMSKYWEKFSTTYQCELGELTGTIRVTFLNGFTKIVSYQPVHQYLNKEM